MKNRVLVVVMALMLLFSLASCTQNTEAAISAEITTTIETSTTATTTWQEAYTLIMRAHDDAVGGNFFLADADGDGTPELYRLMNFRGNEIYISDFVRGSREVYSPLEISELYFNAPDGTLGVYHRDGGPAGDFGVPHHECFGEYRYVDGEFVSLTRLVRNWVTQHVADTVSIPELESITLDEKEIPMEEYETLASHFYEKYSASYSRAIEMYCYEEGMDLNTCWAR